MYVKWIVILTLLVVVSANAPMAQGQATSTHRKKAAKLFEENDANKDGKLSRGEFPQQKQRLFDTVDTNKDGLLTIEEDIAYRVSRLVRRGRRQVAQPEQSKQAQQSDRTNHINGSVNMSQIQLVVFVATVSLDTPLQAIDLPPELPLWEKPPLDYTIGHDVKEQVRSHKARKLKRLEQRMAGILNAYDALLKPERG